MLVDASIKFDAGTQLTGMADTISGIALSEVDKLWLQYVEPILQSLEGIKQLAVPATDDFCGLKRVS